MPQGNQGTSAQGQRTRYMPTPAAFNRLARLQRHSVGAISHTDDVSGRFLELPNVGYHYRLLVPYDLALTSVAVPTGRFLSGHFGANTTRFVCPTGICRSLKYTLNVSSPIYETDGYGNYVLQTIANRGIDPFRRQATTDVGFNRKERSLFAILNSTTGAIVQPDSLVVGATNYNLRGLYAIMLTLGEAATAGLIPVQDIRIAPQLFMDLGNRGDLVSVPADFTASPTGNYNVYLDYFTTPNAAVSPDTNFVMQTRRDLVSVVNTGEQFHRPQIGGIFLRNVFTVWNNSRAVDCEATIELLRLRIQQGIILESRSPKTFIADERRWYSKLLMDEVFAWDHIAGFGDPGMPSLRDRVASNQLTRLEYILNWAAGTAPVATAELRNYIQQLVPLPRVM